MTITLELALDVEQALLVQARAKGLTLTGHLEEIARREAQQASAPAVPTTTLVEFFRSSPLVGLELDLERDTDAASGQAHVQKGASGSSAEDPAEQSQ